MSKLEYTNYYSHILDKTVNIEITGHFGYPIVMFPTSQGSYTQNKDFHLNDSVRWFLEQGKIKLYNVQTFDNDNLYNKSISPEEKIYRYEAWVKFMIQELIPQIQKIHKTKRVAIAGASFGGYHAANLAFRFPDMISHLICLSGAFNIRSFMDGAQNDLIYFNSPNEFVPNDEAWKYKHMKIVLSTSDQDICLKPTQEMAQILTQKGIDHLYDERKWINHDWPLWRMVFPMFIGKFF